MTSQIGDTVGAYTAKTHFAELLEKVQAGDEITITRHGTPVARLVPIIKAATREQRRAAIERISKRRETLSLGELKVRDLIEKGRR